MPSVDEARNIEGGAASLLAGLRTIALNQKITFTQYIRKVLPLDGYVFWLATKSIQVSGSLHVSADKRQLEDETITVNRVIFTTGTEIELFNLINPATLWVGQYGDLKFAFSQRGAFFKASGLFHYNGDAVYPALETQLVELGQQLSDRTLIVSNSLPAWLQLLSYSPVWLQPPNPAITLFPSFVVPANIRPPYGSVHIAPNETQPLQAIPAKGLHHESSHQLARDLVRVTLYGLTNAQALAFENLVLQFSQDTDAIGIMAPMIIRDEKRTQAELSVLAMKKTIEFEVSYQQQAINDIARQLIESAPITYLPQPYGAP